MGQLDDLLWVFCMPVMQCAFKPSCLFDFVSPCTEATVSEADEKTSHKIQS